MFLTILDLIAISTEFNNCSKIASLVPAGDANAQALLGGPITDFFKHQCTHPGDYAGQAFQMSFLRSCPSSFRNRVSH